MVQAWVGLHRRAGWQLLERRLLPRMLLARQQSFLDRLGICKANTRTTIWSHVPGQIPRC